MNREQEALLLMVDYISPFDTLWTPLITTGLYVFVIATAAFYRECRQDKLRYK